MENPFVTPNLASQNWSRTFLSFFDDQKIDKADVIVHSMGGHIAVRFATEYPDRVSKLVLLDIGPHDMVDAYPEFAVAIRAAC